MDLMMKSIQSYRLQKHSKTNSIGTSTILKKVATLNQKEILCLKSMNKLFQQTLKTR